MCQLRYMELQERITKFNEEMKPLLEKYKLDIGAQAMFTEDGRIMAQAVLVEKKEKKE